MELLLDFSPREWLIVSGVLLVLTVLIDGLRRMRNEHKNQIKVSLGMGGSLNDSDEGYGPELPNGGARNITRKDPIISEQGADDILSEQPSTEDNSAPDAEETPGAGLQLSDEHEIIILFVKAKSAHGFNGSDLLQILLACDMRYGERDILHRHEQADGQGSLQFSVANMIEPGTFSLEDINSFRTPGVTFFMTLPGPEDPKQAFDCMLETANCLVNNLGATLVDEEHNVVTTTIAKRYQERIQHFSEQRAERQAEPA